jgi:glycosyltransferase involved in cell wall biosynthesis
MSKSVAIIGTRGYPSYYGGFETAVRKLAPFLVDAGWDVTVYGRHGSTSDDDETRDIRVKTVVTSGIESKSLSTLSYGLTAVLHTIRSKPDVALVMNVANGFWLPLLRLRGIPAVVNVDGIEWERAKWGRLAKGIFKLSAHFTALFGNTLVADAAEIQRRWIRGFARESVFIPYGGDIPESLPLESGLEHRSYVLLVARFVPENTVVEFFDAAEVLAKTRKVVIVGSSGYGGPLDERAAELARKYDNVKWLGHVSDDRRLLALWQHAGAYFHGHSVGGTNPALVQAMACGAPIIARDTVYNREVLAAGAEFVAPEPGAIASAVSALLTDTERQSRLSSLGLERAREYYSWELVCSLYEETLAKSAGELPSRESNPSPIAGKAISKS